MHSFILAALVAVTAFTCHTAPALAAKKAEAAPIAAGAQLEKVNINTADTSGLQQIRGVGPKMAERIIAYRNEKGRFQKPEELVNVRGIGPVKFEKLKDQITV